MGKVLDRAKMLRRINRLVNNDWAFDMEWKLMPDSKPYTQEEAEQMAQCITRIYMVSHCITCSACQKKWLIDSPKTINTNKVGGA